MNYIKLTSSLLLLWLFFVTGKAEEPSDSVIALHEVTVTARTPVREVIPVQTLAGEELRRLNSNSVADALRYFSGVQVKDYGGVGGIKTVNIRSMGTNHTGVVYDGVALGNAQNGQIDLGQFSLDNMEALSLHNGQKSNILQPASDFGNAGTIYMCTRAPRFAADESYHVRAGVRTGSFDLINPSALLELRLSPAVNVSLSAEWLKSSGKYKFRYRRVTQTGETAYDTTAVRQNGDINATRVEVNFYGVTAGGTWTAKAYNYISERGVPGAIVNNVWRRGERIWDNNSFAQGQMILTSGKWTMLNTAKYAFYRTRYVNNDESQLKIDNIYKQQEVYISSSHQYNLDSRFSLSAAYDFKWNDLHADVYGFARPDRFSNLLSVAADMDLGRIKGQVSLLATFIRDNIKGHKTSKNRHALTPAVYISGYPLRKRDFSVRTFFKQSFRMPTFNDLYYADMGNSGLAPERVTQYNLGLLYDASFRGVVSAVRISADGYYNYVTNKIVAYPKGQQFRWTMLNLGKVDIRGVDVAALVTVMPFRGGTSAFSSLELTLRGQYTYQKAIDVTNPSDSYYRHQIPYIPHHSGSAVLNIAWRRWNLNCSRIYVGARYNQQENIIYNYTSPWNTTDISASRDFDFGKCRARVLLEVNNLFNRDYVVILNYPMPKRNFRISLSVEF